MKSRLRLPLYVALVLAGILTAIFKRDDQFGMILGMIAIAVGFMAIFRWSQQKPDLYTEEKNSPESSSSPPKPK